MCLPLEMKCLGEKHLVICQNCGKAVVIVGKWIKIVASETIAETKIINPDAHEDFQQGVDYEIKPSPQKNPSDVHTEGK